MESSIERERPETPTGQPELKKAKVDPQVTQASKDEMTTTTTTDGTKEEEAPKEEITKEEETSTSKDALATGGFGGFATKSSGFQSFANSSGFSTFSSFQSSSEGFGTTVSSNTSEATPKKKDKESVQLKPTEVANGEEDEKIVLEQRAKLYRFDGKDYREVGVGPMRLLKSKQDGASRIVMRRESHPRGPGLVLILNIRMSACVAVDEKTEKSMLLTFVDKKEGEDEVKPVTYLVRVGEAEHLSKLKEQIELHAPEKK